MKVDEAMKSRQIKTESSNFEKNEGHAIVLISDRHKLQKSIFRDISETCATLGGTIPCRLQLKMHLKSAFDGTFGWNLQMQTFKRK